MFSSFFSPVIRNSATDYDTNITHFKSYGKEMNGSQNMEMKKRSNVDNSNAIGHRHLIHTSDCHLLGIYFWKKYIKKRFPFNTD